MRTRQFVVGFFGGVLPATLGTAASASALVTAEAALSPELIAVFLALWICALTIAVFCKSTRVAWRVMLYLAALCTSALPGAWYGFTLYQVAHHPDSLLALSGNTLLGVVTIVAVPLALLFAALGLLVGLERQAQA